MESEEPETRKQRKSVAFTEQKLVVSADGSVQVMATPNEEKDTAVSHSPSTPPLSAALQSTNPFPATADEALNAPADGAADDGSLDLTLMKKKKKKVKKEEDVEGNGDDAAAAAEDGGLDLGMKKKKKKKVHKDGDDEFAAKLAALDLEGKEGEAGDVQEAQEGDMKVGTGIWENNNDTPIVFEHLLARFYDVLTEKNPDHATGSTKSYKIPPPQCLREGNKKTIFANLPEICKRMKRSDEHVIAYLFAELGTSGSTTGAGQLVIKGRFQQKQIEAVLRKYIIEYVSCKTCRSADTELSKGENRLSFVTCNSCGSRRSVAAIKTGFSAQIGKRRKMHG